METISNIASTATSTVSNLIYGQPAKDNETAGKEPLSGEQGKGTAKEPFDQGNAENPVNTSSSTNTFLNYSSNEIAGKEPISGLQGKGSPAELFDQGNTAKSGDTSSKSDDFLTLSPAMGKPSNTESSTETKTGASNEPGMPIVPLNPDVATMGSGKTDTSSASQTGITDKVGISDSVWKPSALDEIKSSGAPGAGPPAPEYTPATPDMIQGSSAPSKEPVSHGVDTLKDTTTTGGHQDSSTLSKEAESHNVPQGSSIEKKHSVSEGVDAIIHPTPKAEHSIDDAEAEDPHSKMASKTVRNTDASKHSASGEEAKSLVEENSAHHHKSSKSHESTSPTGDDDKDGKMSLKERLKNKLHISSKDK